MDQNALASLVANILQQQLPTILKQVQQGAPPTPPTPQAQESLTPSPSLSRSTSGLSRSTSGLSRSTSGLSRSSSGFTTPRSNYSSRSSSPPPPPSKRNSPCLEILGGSDDDEDSQPGASAAYEEERASDRRRVRKPVLRKLDAKFLAPQRSPLFKRFYCKQACSDGSRKLKKNRDLDEKLFKHLVRPVLRRLLGLDPMGGGVHMVQRLYRAAKSVTKKRRANHIQSWRVNGTCKKLIYGGTLPPNAAVAAATSRRAKGLSVVKPEPEQRKKVVEPKVTDDVVLHSNSKSDVVISQPTSKKVGSSAGPKTFPRKTSCCDCGKKMEFNAFFEQDHKDWESGCASQHVRCPPCFEKFVESEVLPNHHGRLVNKRKLSQTSPDSPYHFVEEKEKTPKPPEEKEKEKTPKPPVAKKQRRTRKKRTKCKCGSTTHFTVRSKNCPLNKKNAEVPVASTTKKSMPSVEEKVSQKKTYSVGDNVCVMWEPRKWFMSHVYSVTPTGYGVYCPVTGATKNVGLDKVRELSASAKIQNPTRADLVTKNAEFLFDGDRDIPPGRWKVRRVLHKKNQFVCVRLSEAPVGTPNVDNFMIHYVMKAVRELEENEREHAFINRRR